MKKRLLSVLAMAAVVAAIVFVGCTAEDTHPAQTETVTATPTPTPTPTAEPTEEPTPTPTATPTPTPEPTKAQAPFADAPTYAEVKLYFVNMCSVDIGMIAIIDPISGEQLNLAGVAAGEVLTTAIQWPSNKTELQWAVYTQGGDLYSESTSDVTGVTKAITISLIGDTAIDQIDVFTE